MRTNWSRVYKETAEKEMDIIPLAGSFILFLCSIPFCVADVGLEECRIQGFATNLLCSSCTQLPQFNLTALIPTCEGCCTKDAVEEEVTTYPFAHLEICGCNIQRFPQVLAFVKSSRVNDWHGLRVNYVRGVLPTLKLLNDDGDVAEVFNVDKWDTDTITEFLNERLEK